MLTTIQTLYAYFIEGDTVFMGRRKTFSKRVSHFLSTVSEENQSPCVDIKCLIICCTLPQSETKDSY